MGYDIRIGNAVLVDEDYIPSALPRWEVEENSLAEAPIFFGDNTHSNLKCPSYGVWGDFCRDVGLEGLFFCQGNRSQEPVGIVRLTPNHLEVTQEALNRYREKCHLLPGYCDEFDRPAKKVEYDGYLARLIWLEWWMQWTIDNCKTPAFFIH